MSESTPLLEVENLQVEFTTRGGTVHAVRDVSFSVDAGETVAIVGESGSGKSITALSIMRLIATPPGRVAGGEVIFGGTDLLRLPEKQMREVRGNRIAMVFQEPISSLNPLMTVGAQIGEAIRRHTSMSGAQVRERVLDLLRMVQIPAAESRINSYPHEFSGGMRQRVMIAIALSCNPELLIADEPTTALDVTVQAQILKLMQDLRERLGMAMILVTHDLAVVSTIARRVLVMYAGQVVEEGPVERILTSPAHPYTRGLLAAIPGQNEAVAARRARRLTEIPGAAPSLRGPFVGCAFAPRCTLADSHCQSAQPERHNLGASHHASCHKVRVHA